MNPFDKQLFLFCVVYTALMTVHLVVPILLRKRDIFTAWNCFLVGSILFTGLSGINATLQPHFEPSYTAGDYVKFCVGVVIFYVTIVFVYHFNRVPRWLSNRVLLRWPPVNTTTLLLMSLALLPLFVARYFSGSIPLVGQLVYFFSVQIPVYWLVFSSYAWLREKSNPVLLIIFAVNFVFSFVFSMSVGGGRLFLITMLLTVPVIYYWVDLRYRRIGHSVFYLGIGLGLAVLALTAYSAVRHARIEQRGLERGVVMARQVAGKFTDGRFDDFMGQNSVECALATIHLLHDKSERLHVKPLYSLYWIATNPMPRIWWPEKPEGVGVILPRALKLKRRGMDANLGINVIGQCYHDGGPLVLVLYAVLLGTFLRVVDELLVSRPGNPYVLAMFCASCSHFIAWPRGAISGYSLLLGCFFVFMLLVNWGGRIVFGSGLVYQSPTNSRLATSPRYSRAMPAT